MLAVAAKIGLDLDDARLDLGCALWQAVFEDSPELSSKIASGCFQN